MYAARRFADHSSVGNSLVLVPDGTRIAFTAKPGDSPDGWQRSVYVMPADGGPPQQVTSSKYNDHGVGWMVAGDR